jgi:hypothetical protein
MLASDISLRLQLFLWAPLLGSDGLGFIGRRPAKNLFKKDGIPKSAGKIAFWTGFCHS